MKISVIIPYYNDSKYFGYCLESVLKQKIKPEEIIIIDDCSKDSHILEKIVDSVSSKETTIKLYRNDTNMNGAYSRNLGMNMAIGDYIAFLDADDYWAEDHLEVCLNNALKFGSDFIYSNVVEIKPNANDIVYRKVSNHRSTIGHISNILLDSPPQTNSFFISSKANKILRFNENLKRHQDYQFFIDALLKSEITAHYIDVYTSYYRVRDKSKPVIDYTSIFGFWAIYKDVIDLNKLNYKLWNIISGGLRDRRNNPINIIGDTKLAAILGGRRSYKLFSAIKNRLILVLLVNFYFYIVLDCGKKIYARFFRK